MDFSAVDDELFACFAEDVSYTPLGGAAVTVSAIRNRVESTMTTEHGVLIPDYDTQFRIRQAAVATRPVKGSTIAVGGRTFKLIGHAAEDAASETWICKCMEKV